MGEWSDEWSAQGKKNIWNTVPAVVEMQSEGGAAGAVHGAMQAGALTTSFTASQGLLLFIPNMYKIAGELTPFVLHVTARTIATHALSIFGDHADVMGCRQTGFAMLSSDSVQQAHDFALIAQASTMKSRVPFLHFFDGFRTSHEVSKIEMLNDDDLRSMVTEEMVADYRSRALTPDQPGHPRHRPEPRHLLPGPRGLQRLLQRHPRHRPGRDGHLRQARPAASTSSSTTSAHPDAERVMIIMGSGGDTAHEYVEWALAKGEKIGVLKVRLFRPFSIKHFVNALPKTVKTIAVMDRCKETGAIGDPLYLDVVTALREASDEGLSHFDLAPKVLAGRYGLSSKEFNPSCIKAIYDNLAKDKPKNHFTVGIVDDVTNTSLPMDLDFDIEGSDVKRAMFFGLGSDGTVGANKNSIKIIAEEHRQLRPGLLRLRLQEGRRHHHLPPALRPQADPLGLPDQARRTSSPATTPPSWTSTTCWPRAEPGATFLLNTPFGKDEVWDSLPKEVQQSDHRQEAEVLRHRRLRSGQGHRHGRAHQHHHADLLLRHLRASCPGKRPSTQIKKAIKKTYGKKGEAVVKKNFEAVDETLANLYEVERARATSPPPASCRPPSPPKRRTSSSASPPS